VRNRLTAGATAAASAAVLLAGLVGCSSEPLDAFDSTPPTIPSATPAQAPPQTQKPAGTVRPLAGTPTAVTFDTSADALLVLLPGVTPEAAASLAVLPVGGGATRTIGLPTPATALATDDSGTALVATRGGFLRVDPDSGSSVRVGVADHDDTDFTAIAHRADGRVVLGSADGAVYILASDGAEGGPVPVEHESKLFARVDSLATQGETTVVLDRGQTSVTTLDPEGKKGQALRAGEGATTMVTDEAGRVLVTDTRGNALLAFTTDPGLIMRQRYPVPSSPVGVAGSPGLVWVSQTAANTVVGYDLSTGIPVEKVRHATVQQPNSLGYDADTDTLFVVSGTGAGVQVIPNATGAP
jgi:outer membrane protein assembly factor BamB